jgi:hypothetical protein
MNSDTLQMTFRHPTNTFQIPYRYLSDTLQIPFRHPTNTFQTTYKYISDTYKYISDTLHIYPSSTFHFYPSCLSSLPGNTCRRYGYKCRRRCLRTEKVKRLPGCYYGYKCCKPRKCWTQHFLTSFLTSVLMNIQFSPTIM